MGQTLRPQVKCIVIISDHTLEREEQVALSRSIPAHRRWFPVLQPFVTDEDADDMTSWLLDLQPLSECAWFARLYRTLATQPLCDEIELVIADAMLCLNRDRLNEVRAALQNMLNRPISFVMSEDLVAT